VTAIIQIEKLTKSYGSHRGIIDIDLVPAELSVCASSRVALVARMGLNKFPLSLHTSYTSPSVQHPERQCLETLVALLTACKEGVLNPATNRATGKIYRTGFLSAFAGSKVFRQSPEISLP
jgi:hypothetical protein